MKEDTSPIDYKGKKYGKRELREYWKAHSVKCPKCGYTTMLRKCPACGAVIPKKEKE